MLRKFESSFSRTNNENVRFCFLFLQKMCWELDGSQQEYRILLLMVLRRSHIILFLCFFALPSALDTPRIWTGPVGFQEVEIPPVHFAEGPALGKCSISEGSQCNQCRVKEKGAEPLFEFSDPSVLMLQSCCKCSELLVVFRAACLLLVHLGFRRAWVFDVGFCVSDRAMAGWKTKGGCLLCLLCAGAVPVRAAHRHSVLAAAPGAAARGARQEPGPPAFPTHRGGRGGAGPEEWSNALLVLRKTQVCE